MRAQAHEDAMLPKLGSILDCDQRHALRSRFLSDELRSSQDSWQGARWNSDWEQTSLDVTAHQKYYAVKYRVSLTWINWHVFYAEINCFLMYLNWAEASVYLDLSTCCSDPPQYVIDPLIVGRCFLEAYAG